MFPLAGQIWHRGRTFDTCVLKCPLQPSSTHMQDLQEVTQDLHYENFRSDRLKRGGRLSSHGYILPLSPAYVLVLLLASLHLPHLKIDSNNLQYTTWISLYKPSKTNSVETFTTFTSYLNFFFLFKRGLQLFSSVIHVILVQWLLIHHSAC